MKKMIVLLLTVFCGLCITAGANAALVRFDFSPNEWVNSSLNGGANPRLLFTGDTLYSNFGYTGSSQLTEGVLAGIKIYDINMWLLGGSSPMWTLGEPPIDGPPPTFWGETLTQKTSSYPFYPTGSIIGGSSGWNVGVYTPEGISLGGGASGYVVDWYDPNYWKETEPYKPLMYGQSGWGTFSFWVDVNEPVNYGQKYTIYLGGWLEDGGRFEGTMEMTAVPNPTTVLLVGSGLICLLALRKRIKG